MPIFRNYYTSKDSNQVLLALLKTIEAIETLCQAANGIEAWHHIKQFRPDVAILEIHLPGLSGLDIARNSVQAGLPTQFVLLTAYEDPLTAIEAQKAGVAGFVVKSNSFEELMLVVRTVHNTVTLGGTALQKFTYSGSTLTWSLSNNGTVGNITFALITTPTSSGYVRSSFSGTLQQGSSASLPYTGLIGAAPGGGGSYPSYPGPSTFATVMQYLGYAVTAGFALDMGYKLGSWAYTVLASTPPEDDVVEDPDVGPEPDGQPLPPAPPPPSNTIVIDVLV